MRSDHLQATPELSIVIPSLNSTTVDQAVAGLSRQPGIDHCEIIVVGRDDPGRVPRAPYVRFIDTVKPVSAAAARNVGITAARARFVAFMDSDCIPHANWLSRVRFHIENSDMPVIAGAVCFVNHPYWTLCDNVSSFYAWTPGVTANVRAVAPTLNLITRRCVIDMVGLLDESFPGAAGEDLDWTLRMRRAGYTISFCPDIVVEHRPARNSFRSLVGRAYGFGWNTIKVNLRYPDLMPQPFYHRNAGALLALAPIIALGVILKIFVWYPAMRRHLHTALPVYIAKIAWRLGGAAYLWQLGGAK